ncbi:MULTISPECIES: UDP-forming cellulose synthase catalytic subunit [unclassified Pantoea]|uniref:UDP-forming cellulose synthase catalytic subunit n=1 Tax=unclassified Pantoea TaxID=2630326 RepID=UPI001CD4EC88|nr:MULTISPECIES: UDP-forming cellulose synthase catalytic subunit [unclassified Pantoea]MCA1178532.1 UDP-forming cellulose synthase catalytic subunit [Pantoea sp. alder69]MCA1253151.1 UDP-forming cellulose synthase catalytic subunit [Pantoea sp. alder70]MCA1266930.1 UDP-forming cellulose synthase catalytic subunit [Pantoea sp. alder81]
MNPLRWLLVPQAWQALQSRARVARQHGTGRLTVMLHLLWCVLAWSLLRLETPGWQRLLQQRQRYYPQISPLRPRPLDVLRYAMQSLWLMLVLPLDNSARSERKRFNAFGPLFRWRQQLYQWLDHVPARLAKTGLHLRTEQLLQKLPGRVRHLLFIVAAIVASLLALLCISQPFGITTQFVFVLLLWSLAMMVRRVPGRLSTIMLIVLSLTISCRYLWWRYTETLNWDDPLSLTFGLLLIGAETYSWTVLVLGYFQTLWPLNRQPVSMPPEITSWPSVDILVPTYNEPLSVVKPTIYAAMGIDWPQDKLNIYLLDDGTREEFREFAASVGIHYVVRPTHEHAKAGNINHALKVACRSDYVAIFDCDHVPTRSFLQLTMGWFLKDHRLAMLQTPHHFFSPDPFERNLGRFRQTPNEGSLFYGLVQDGNDTWDAAFFCGSCAVLRRTALDEIGGIAVETVTEDAHTSLRLHRQGYTSAYIRIPQAAGLATESLSAHIGQRIRWARGMVQIFRLDNPLMGKGLKLVQRLCYANAMLHFLAGIPRLIFLLAPLAFLLCHAYIIYAPALAIAIYVLPHMVHTSLTNSRIQGRWRHSFWSEVYETVLAWYIARPTTVALFNPHKGKFNVTAKGGLVEERHLDWVITKPYMMLVLLNIAGIGMAFWRMAYGPANEMLTIWVSLVWVVYNMIILGGAVAVSVEARQIREAHRVEIAMPAAIAREDGHMVPCTLRDYSDGGVGVELREADALKEDEPVWLLLRRGQQEFSFPCQVQRVFGRRAGIRLHQLTTRQHIEFIQCTFARADTWALWQDGFPEDKPVQSLADIMVLGFKGYLRLAEYGPAPLRRIFRVLTSLVSWLATLLPQGIGRAPAAIKTDFS